MIQNVYEDRTVSCLLMSKRSVDKGDRGKKTSAGAQEGRPWAATSVPLEKKANDKSKANIQQNSDLYLYAGLILAALLSLYLRAYIPWKSVFTGNSVIFSSESDAWYHMMLAQGIVVNHERLWFDPMTFFPHGTPLFWGPFLDWSIANEELIERHHVHPGPPPDKSMLPLMMYEWVDKPPDPYPGPRLIFGHQRP